MPVLQPSEYNAYYFDGGSQSLAHNAGYRKYRRWYRRDSGSFPNADQHFDEYWKDIAYKITQRFNLNGKKILDIGCAYGFLVEDLRGFGVDAYGLDVSQYAYDQASEIVKPYLTVADARTHLQTYADNEFWALCSIRFLPCMSDEDLAIVVPEMNRISKYQVHSIDLKLLPEYYNTKTIEEWMALSFAKGTLILPRENNNQEFIKA